MTTTEPRISTEAPRYTVPGMETSEARTAVAMLQDRLVCLVDLGLTLKHIHWNVVGPMFVGVHEMLDPQYAAVQQMIDRTAERIATLGGSPKGLPGFLVEHRRWEDYPLDRASVPQHLAALDLVYRGVITDHRACMEKLEQVDKVSQEMLIEQIAQLEQFQWFVRAHLEDPSGALPDEQQLRERRDTPVSSDPSRSSAR